MHLSSSTSAPTRASSPGHGPTASAQALPPALQVALADIRRQLAEIRAEISGAAKEFFTVAEVARWTGRSEYTVRRWIGEGRIRATRVAGDGPRGRLLVPRGELARLVSGGLAAEMPDHLAG